MKFIVVTYGTEGDARPFAALCRGLMDNLMGIETVSSHPTLRPIQS